MGIAVDKVGSIDSHLDGVIHDSPDILFKLSRLQPKEGNPIEIVTELPAALSPDIIIGYVQRWREIQQHFDCELRVYAWSYTMEVEKYILGCTLNMKHIAVTTLPMYLKETITYGK